MTFPGLTKISIRHKLQLFTGLVVVGASVLFSTVNYLTQREALLRGIDQKLVTSTYLAEHVPPPGYFEGIEDESSVSKEAFDSIVDTHNKLCVALDLQYLWSCMKIGDSIHFTTSTSPGKDVTKQDHAPFFAVHNDPHAFDGVFGRMEADYSSFHNEWGHGRMVLVPRVDSKGRPYCLGASIGINDVHALLQRSLAESVALGLVILLAGFLASVIVSNSISKPIVHLTEVADRITHGELDQDVKATGSTELVSLSQSISEMSTAIRETIAALEMEIDERKAAQEALQRHRNQLEETVRQRTAELQRSNEDLQQFAYVASHDLQEPLRTIRGFTELLRKRYHGQLDSDADEFIGFVCDGVSRMQELILALLMYARVDTGGKPFEPVDVGSSLDRALVNLGGAIAESDAKVEHSDLPTVKADESQLTQVFQNVLGNAIKFRGEAPPRIRVSAERGENEWLFSVQDNGIGFEPRFRERVFAIFQRLHSPGKYPGTGIGLAYCKKVVERRGGRIWVASELGKGSTFHFTIPDQAPQPTGPNWDGASSSLA